MISDITANALKGEAERCLAALCERLQLAANRQDWHDIDACVVALPECSRELRERLGNYQ